MTIKWETPAIETVGQSELEKTIISAACSKFVDECLKHYIFSFPPFGGETI